MNQATTSLQGKSVTDTRTSTGRDFRVSPGGGPFTANPEPVAVFFFAGHGVQVRGENFLLPVALGIHPSFDNLNSIQVGTNGIF